MFEGDAIVNVQRESEDDAMRGDLVAYTDEIVCEVLDDGGALRGLDGRGVLGYEDGLLCLDDHTAVALRRS